MAAKPIDENRGCIVRFGPGNVEVVMYKDEPGIYLTNTGAMVSEKIAAAAGFPVKDLAQKRDIQLRKTAALSAIEDEFQSSTEEKTIAEGGGFSVVSIGLGRHEVRDPNGVTLTEMPMSRKEAEMLLSKLAPAEPVAEVDSEALAA